MDREALYIFCKDLNSRQQHSARSADATMSSDDHRRLSDSGSKKKEKSKEEQRQEEIVVVVVESTRPQGGVDAG
jgi:hypothetical protein